MKSKVVYYEKEFNSIADMCEQLNIREDYLRDLLSQGVEFNTAVDRIRNRMFAKRGEVCRVYKGYNYKNLKALIEKTGSNRAMLTALLGHGIPLDEAVEHAKTAVLVKNGVKKREDYATIGGVTYRTRNELIEKLGISGGRLNYLMSKDKLSKEDAIKQCIKERNVKRDILVSNKYFVYSILNKEFFTVNGMVFINFETLCKHYNLREEDVLIDLISTRNSIENTINKLRR